MAPIVHWPNGFTARGEIRNQFHHVIDVAPTVLDVVGLPEPTFVHGVQQVPYEGVSMRYTFEDGSAADRHETQYFEMFVNRGIYHKGWTAVTRHSTPWVVAPLPPIDDDVWELYAPDDWTQAHDLASEQPERLHELQRLFLIEAVRHNVLPLDDRRVERFNSDLAGRPQLITRAPPDPLRRDGTPVGELCRRDQEQVIRDHSAGRCPGRLAPMVSSSRRAGRSADGRSTPSRADRPTATTCSGSAGSRSTATRRSRAGSTRSGSSSPTTAGGSARAARRRCTLTVPRSARPDRRDCTDGVLRG